MHKPLIMELFFSFRTPVFNHFFGLNNGSEQLGNPSMRTKKSGKVYNAFSPFVGLDPFLRGVIAALVKPEDWIIQNVGF